MKTLEDLRAEERALENALALVREQIRAAKPVCVGERVTIIGRRDGLSHPAVVIQVDPNGRVWVVVDSNGWCTYRDRPYTHMERRI